MNARLLLVVTLWLASTATDAWAQSSLEKREEHRCRAQCHDLKEDLDKYCNEQYPDDVDRKSKSKCLDDNMDRYKQCDSECQD